MSRDARTYVADMLRACEDIQSMVSGIGLEEFTADRIRLKAVIRDLEVIGEACRSLAAEVRALAPDVPWPRIIGLRNRLIDAYFGVDPAIVLRTATEDLPKVLPALRELMAELERRSRLGGDGPSA